MTLGRARQGRSSVRPWTRAPAQPGTTAQLRRSIATLSPGALDAVGRRSGGLTPDREVRVRRHLDDGPPLKVHQDHGDPTVRAHEPALLDALDRPELSADFKPVADPDAGGGDHLYGTLHFLVDRAFGSDRFALEIPPWPSPSPVWSAASSGAASPCCGRAPGTPSGLGARRGTRCPPRDGRPTRGVSASRPMPRPHPRAPRVRRRP